eukprot:s2710_g7.t1
MGISEPAGGKPLGYKLHLLPVRSFNSVLSDVSRSRWELAPQLLAALAECAGRGNSVTFNAAMTGCQRASKWQQVVQTMRTFKTRQLCPSAVSFNVLLGAWEASNHWPRGMSSLHAMGILRVPRNTVVYNAGISSCSWRCSEVLLRALVDQQLETSCVTSNSAIALHMRTSHWQTALFIGHTALPTPDVFGHSSLISAVGGTHWPLALHLAGAIAMSQRSVVSRNALLSSCEKCQEWQLAALLFCTLHAQTVEANVKGSGALLASLAACGRWPQAFSALRRAVRRGVRAAVVSRSAVISACHLVP